MNTMKYLIALTALFTVSDGFLNINALSNPKTAFSRSSFQFGNSMRNFLTQIAAHAAPSSVQNRWFTRYPLNSSSWNSTFLLLCPWFSAAYTAPAHRQVFSSYLAFLSLLPCANLYRLYPYNAQKAYPRFKNAKNFLKNFIPPTAQPLPFSFPSRVLNGRICSTDALFARTIIFNLLKFL